MRFPTLATAMVPIVAVVFTGCLTPAEIEPVRQYVLDVTADVSKQERSEVTLGVRPLKTARPVDLAMAYLDDDSQITYQDHAAWAEQPAESVTRALRDALEATGRFADVGDAALMARPELVLTGEIRKFHEDRTVEPAEAVVTLRIEVRWAMANKSVWSDTLVARVPLEGSDASDFARAMGAAVSTTTGQAASAIAESDLTKPE